MQLRGAGNLDAMPSDVAYHALNVYARSVVWTPPTGCDHAP